MTETYKDILGYEQLYKISTFGNVMSYDKIKFNGKGYHLLKGKILKLCFDDKGYLNVCLHKNKVQKSFAVHKLVSMAFLNHIPNKRVTHINHIDFDKSNNHVDNLEVITARENLNKKHLKSTSNYTGVCWHKASNKWIAKIVIKNSHFHLGIFKSEIRAKIAYEFALLQVNKIENIINLKSQIL